MNISTMIPEEELSEDILAVQRIRNIGNGNVVMNVNKWFSVGDKINIIKYDNNYILSKRKIGVERTVRRAGSSSILSFMKIAPEGYYTVKQTGKDLQLELAKTEYVLRFARKYRHSKSEECLIEKRSDYFIYVKQENLAIFDRNKNIFAEFHQTKDNLMWFELFQDGSYTEEATQCNFYEGHHLYVPREIVRLTNLDKGDILTCFQNGNRLIIELPDVSCETCNTTINRRTQPSKTITVSASTKENCKIIKTQISDKKESGLSSSELIKTALTSVRTINKLLGGN